MAGLTIEQLEAKLAELEEKNQTLEVEKQRQGDELAKLNDAIAKAQENEGKLALPVAGSFDAQWKDPKGKTVKRKVEFQDGALKVRIKSGHIVSSEALLKVANGEELSKEELEGSKALSSLKEEEAAEWLTHLAKINYGLLKPV